MTDNIIQAHVACPCGDSSDAFTVYDDHGYCFSCNKYYSKESLTGIDFTTQSQPKPNWLYTSGSHRMKPKEMTFPYRGISKQTYDFAGVSFLSSSVPTDTEPVIKFPYPSFTKIRTPNKEFITVGENSTAKELFLMDKFARGGKFITIVEGEFDALSVIEMNGSWPVVSVRSASFATIDCKANIDYLNSFQKIILCLDNDGPGRKATQKITQLFEPNKVYVMKLQDGYKDANQYLVEGKAKEFKALWWAAKQYMPETIISGVDTFTSILKEKPPEAAIKLPFECLQQHLYGLYKGKTLIITAQEGTGKTEFLRKIEYNTLINTDEPIGIIHLEESKQRLLQGLVGLDLSKHVHLPHSDVSVEQQEQIMRKLLKYKDNKLYVYSHFDTENPSIILDTIRYMVTVLGCGYIFFDHITLAVTGSQEEDERKALDYLSTKLGTMVEDLNFSLTLISHLNDANKTRGSRNISKMADSWVHLDRDLLEEDFEKRNTTKLIIKKNRFGGFTGYAGEIQFDLDTFTFKEKGVDVVSQEEVVTNREFPW